MTTQHHRRVSGTSSAPPGPIGDRLGQDIPWQAFALCAQTDPDAFFVGVGQSAQPAKRVCGNCPVRNECLEHALTHAEHGVWGGLTEKQRRPVRRARRTARRPHSQ
ncbi:WhiB family transcriptional regulator [Actinomadura sp. NBRC 104412]|uniref:WhiB family transcriptional regulator n=1 Tax=Actinomadura sp. NBRC 104412 TaxID=3032203 RepID=UPI0025577711|nr:WhiB family transcriptional regulator [Actinomadura sp. NBRC 104412]